jgi:hypothetical protein
MSGEQLADPYLRKINSMINAPVREQLEAIANWHDSKHPSRMALGAVASSALNHVNMLEQQLAALKVEQNEFLAEHARRGLRHEARVRNLESAVHDAITRVLSEACVKSEVLIGMCIEVGLEAYRDALAKSSQSDAEVKR